MDMDGQNGESTAGATILEPSTQKEGHQMVVRRPMSSNQFKEHYEEVMKRLSESHDKL